MEYVNGKVYYHIQSKASWNKYPQWQQGSTYTIGRSKNPWFGYFDENGKNIANPTTGKVFTADTVAALILAHQDGQPQDPELKAFFSYDIKNAIIYLRAALSHYVKFARETVYEEVRVQNFPELPSRQRCTWVVPDDENTAEYMRFWWPKLNQNERRILKLELTGKLHKTNEEFLLFATNPLDYDRQYAFKYWSGEQGADINKIECLFEGIVKVLAIIDPVVYGI